MSTAQITLSGTRNELAKINTILQSRCTTSYKLDLSQYKYRSLDATVYDETSEDYSLILCLYHRDRCVSSVTGKYSEKDKSMEILSKTGEMYEGLKINIYLRSVFMYLMCFVRPTIKVIYSYSVNPISTYLMYTHYGASNTDLNEYVEERGLTPETFTLINAKEFHDYFVEKYRQTRESAEQLVEEMLEDVGEGEDGLAQLGWDTKEDGINYIINNMNRNAIALELDLANNDIQDFLYQKLLATHIKCEDIKTTRHTSYRIKPAYGKRAYSKSTRVKYDNTNSSNLKRTRVKRRRGEKPITLSPY